MVLNSKRITIEIFLNLKAAVAYVNSLGSRALCDPLDYQAVVYRLKRYGSFPLEIGGMDHSISVMGINGKFIESQKRGIEVGSVEHVSFNVGSEAEYSRGSHSISFSPEHGNYRKFSRGKLMGFEPSRKIAVQWVDGQFRQDLIASGQVG